MFKTPVILSALLATFALGCGSGSEGAPAGEETPAGARSEHTSVGMGSGEESMRPPEPREEREGQPPPAPRQVATVTSRWFMGQTRCGAWASGASHAAGEWVEGPAAVTYNTPNAPCLILRDGRARADEMTTQLVVLAEGEMHITVPAVGASARRPVRVATPRGTLTLAGNGEAWVSTGDGGTLMGVIRGLGHAQVPPADPADSVREVALRPGRAWLVGAEEVLEIGDTLAAFIEAGRPVRVSRATPRGLVDLSLEAAVSAARAEVARGEALADVQRGLRTGEDATEADREAAREAQAGLVAHSRRLRHTRRRLRVLAEMTLARGQALPAGVRPLVTAARPEGRSTP